MLSQGGVRNVVCDLHFVSWYYSGIEGVNVNYLTFRVQIRLNAVFQDFF